VAFESWRGAYDDQTLAAPRLARALNRNAEALPDWAPERARRAIGPEGVDTASVRGVASIVGARVPIAAVLRGVVTTSREIAAIDRTGAAIVASIGRVLTQAHAHLVDALSKHAVKFARTELGYGRIGTPSGARVAKVIGAWVAIITVLPGA